LPSLAADLVQRRVVVIVASATPGAALAAKAATTTIPIVFQIGNDPVKLGLVASISRPGGNITGASFLVQELVAKRLELLHEIVPTTTTIGFLVNPTMSGIETQIKEAEAAARTLGVHLVISNATSPGEIEPAFVTLLGQQIGALMSGSDALLFEQNAQIIALAARHAVPTIYTYGGIVRAGGLISYGSVASDAFRLAGVYAGRILNGEKPAELPVQESTKVELVLNMKTAKALGLTIPPSLLATAYEVIE
jgi:putative ABC transport system substrate-binding protein